MSSVNKKFGREVTTFADDDTIEFGWLPLGISQFDALTRGGIPLGKVTMFRGPESGGKTTHAMIAIARYMARYQDDLAIYIDAEEKYPKQLLPALGIDQGRFVCATPETAEETIDYVEHCLRNRNVGCLVLDSIAAMIPRIEIEAKSEEQQRGLAARQINKMVRKMITALKSARMKWRKSATVILINQERTDLSIRFGDPVTIPGGVGQKYACTLAVRFRALNIKRDEDDVRLDAPLAKIAATVVKNSYGPRGRGTEYLMAMEKFKGLSIGDARDEGFVYLQARRLGLVEPSDEHEQEVYDRGQLYHELKNSILDRT